jgi:hypothetical protein
MAADKCQFKTEHNPSWGADSLSLPMNPPRPIKEIRKFVTVFRVNRHWSHLSQMNPVHVFITYLLKIRFNVIIPSAFRSRKRFLSFKFSD